MELWDGNSIDRSASMRRHRRLLRRRFKMVNNCNRNMRWDNRLVQKQRKGHYKDLVIQDWQITKKAQAVRAKAGKEMVNEPQPENNTSQLRNMVQTVRIRFSKYDLRI